MNKLIFAATLCLFSHSVFAVDLDFYVYGDFDSTVGAFRRAALIFADADYLGLFFTACVFGIFSGGVTMFYSGIFGQLDAGKIIQYVFYPIMGVTLYTTLILQTGTMHVFDETQNKYEAVGGVPDGIVILAGAFNKFERVVADVASDNPATVRSSLASGTGIKLFLDAFASNPLTNAPDLQKSLSNLVMDCTDLSMRSNPALDLEYIRSLAPNSIAVLQAINTNALSTTTYDNDGVPTVRTCAAASANIVGRLNLLNFDEQTEALCLDAGYEVGLVNAAAERAACRTQLENVGNVFLGPAFGGTARELFTNIAVYNTIATSINDTNVTINGLGSRQIASEGISTLAVTEDWLPQIRGGMLVTILSLLVLIAIFLVTPLFAKALKVMMALFFFLATWGAASSLQLMNAYDQVIYASRSIAFHGGGLEAYLLAPTTAIQSLAIIGDSLSTAMMFAAALTTIFTGVSAYGFSNALAHAAGKVEVIGENQGRNLTQEGKADLTERNANAYATNSVSGSMGAENYGSAHVQSAIEKNYSAHGRSEGISSQGGVSAQVSTAEGQREGGSMIPTSNLANPAQYGHDGAQVDMGSKLSQIDRAGVAGDGNIQAGSQKLENVKSSSTTATLESHNKDNNAVDKTSRIEADYSKSHAEGLEGAANAAPINTSVNDIGRRAGLAQGAEQVGSKKQYRTDEDVVEATSAKIALSAGNLNQNLQDANALNPNLETPTDKMYALGKEQQSLSNNPVFGAQNISRADEIAGEELGFISRAAEAKMLGAVTNEFFNPEGGPIGVDDKMAASIAESPLRSIAVEGSEMAASLERNGLGHLAGMIDKNDVGELTAATTIDENGDLRYGNTTYSQGGETVFTDMQRATVGSDYTNADNRNYVDRVTEGTFTSAAQDYKNNPQAFEELVDQLDEKTPSELFAISQEINAGLPATWQGNMGTTDTFTFTTGSEAHAGVSTGILEQVGLDAGARVITNTLQDNVDTLEGGAQVNTGAIQIFEKLMEIRESSPNNGDVVDDGRLQIGRSSEQDAKTDRTAAYLSGLWSTSYSTGKDSTEVDDVNRVNDHDSGKTRDVLGDFNRRETELYRSQGWETGNDSYNTPITPQIEAAQQKQLEEQEALNKKINMYRVN